MSEQENVSTDSTDPEDHGYPLDDETVDGAGFTFPSTGTPVPRSAAIRGKSLNAPKTKGTKAKGVKRNSNRILVKERQRRALEARKMGATYQKIAEALGYSDAGAARKAVLKAYDEIIQEDTEELRTLQLERLNDMLTRIWNRVAAGDDSAIRTALSIMDRMDAIKGTLSPQKVDQTVTTTGGIIVIDGDKDDYVAAMRKMAGVDRDGQNTTAQQVEQEDPLSLPSGRRYPPGMEPQDDVVEAEVVEEDGYLGAQVEAMSAALDGAPEDEALKKRIREITTPAPSAEAEAAQPAQPTKRKFDFSVEPKRKRSDG